VFPDVATFTQIAVGASVPQVILDGGSFPFIEPVLGERRDVLALKEYIRKDQPPLFVGFHIGHDSV
jgi:hypothetical protein